MSAVFVWLLSGALAGLLVGAAATWLVMRNRPVEPVGRPAPPVQPQASLGERPEVDPATDQGIRQEPDQEVGPDMGRTAEAMLAELERKFEAMRKAEAEQATKPRRKKPPRV